MSFFQTSNIKCKGYNMKKLYIATDKAVAIVRQPAGEWVIDLQLTGMDTQCLAVDPQHPEEIYCGTFGQGLWHSHDAGITWENVGTNIIHEQVMSVAISPLEHSNGRSAVYVGTEPSAIYRSDDGGASWRDLATLRQLPSASTWSFPPRPYTHHVRWMTPDPLQAGRIYAAIEAGALLRSFDGGETWEDRKPDGPFDTHTLVMHKLAPNRLYSAAGDGFMRPGNGFVESDNGGDSWYRPDEGLNHHYLWSVAVDPADPDTIVISAAHGPQQAHNPMGAESAVYRRSHNSPWQQVRAGLPEEKGLLTSVLTSNPAEAGVFYAGSNKGIFRSPDAGVSWQELPLRWPDNFRVGRVHALVALEE
ncbi:MAG: glycosyl hydrolase [Ktedonobacteraceae bacterium]|nr:glycosyl hydrolase [Ktedonobacteraceae bacterium]